MAFDLVLRGGDLADGDGGPLRQADVAVQDGCIVAVGKLAGRGKHEINARGKLVTPGFVDIHTHYDGQATWDSRMQPSSWHGVTTAVMAHHRRDQCLQGLSVVTARFGGGLAAVWRRFRTSIFTDRPDGTLGLHFDQILGAKGSAGGTALLRDLVIARVMAPGSKRGSAAELDEHYGRSYPLDRVYRMMDALHKRLDRLKQIVLEATVSLTGGAVQVMLFDITTLYFESVDVGALRAFGYSKDQKYHCTQVVLALATDEDGLPIGCELFPGNTAEVKTLLACMQQWQQSLKVGKVSFVADRALCSKANLEALEAAPGTMWWPCRCAGV